METEFGQRFFGGFFFPPCPALGNVLTPMAEGEINTALCFFLEDSDDDGDRKWGIAGPEVVSPPPRT